MATFRAMQQHEFTAVAARYVQMRKLCYSFATEALGIPGLELRPIYFCDAVQGDSWRLQWNDPAKRPTWEWVELFNRYNTRQGVKRFEVAVWLRGVLCGLCYGFPNKSKLILRIHAIGRAPNGNQLAGKVLPVLLASADAYALLLGSKEVWICEPMNSELVALYAKHKFSPVTADGGQVTHLIRRTP
jgi:hypothetical protein